MTDVQTGSGICGATKLDPLDMRSIVWDLDKLEPRACPICHSSGSATVCRRPDELTVVRCETCRCIYISPAPTADALDRFYETYHQDHFVGQPVHEFHPYDVRDDPRLAYVDRLMRSTSTMAVLDFGCGTGSFLSRVKMLGADVWGVDIDSAAVRACHAAGLDTVVQGGPGSISSLPRMFDLIALNDVIEHPLDPDRLLADLLEKLKPGGRLLIWTPNGDSLTTDPARTLLRVDLEHMQYLCAETIARVCLNHDLVIDHYEQNGFPYAGNFISGDGAAAGARRRARLASLIRRVGLGGLARSLKRRLVGSPDLRGGDYVLFCVLRKQHSNGSDGPVARR